MNTREFKVGDKVWDFLYGWGTVTNCRENCDFPVGVKFDGNDKESFTKDGKYYEQRARTLFFEEIPIPESALIKKRWRAKKGEHYYYVSSCGKIAQVGDMCWRVDNERYNCGNYFKTEEEAKESKFYKTFHEEV